MRVKKVEVAPTLDNLVASFLSTSASSARDSTRSPGVALPWGIAGCPTGEKMGVTCQEEKETTQSLESDFERVL